MMMKMNHFFENFLTSVAPARKNTRRALRPYQSVAEMGATLRPIAPQLRIQFQREWLAFFVAAVAVLGMVAGLYLNVTASAAIAGREIQALEAQIAANQRVNADLQTNIAVQLSHTVLHQRALELGYQPVSREDLEYVVVPGYYPPQGVELVTPVVTVDPLAASPEYTESLFDWLARQIQSGSRPLN